MWEVMCGGHSEAMRHVHGLHVAGALQMQDLLGMGGSRAVSWVVLYLAFFGRRLRVCRCGGKCSQRVGEGCPVLLVELGSCLVWWDRSRSACQT